MNTNTLATIIKNAITENHTLPVYSESAEELLTHVLTEGLTKINEPLKLVPMLKNIVLKQGFRFSKQPIFDKREYVCRLTINASQSYILSTEAAPLCDNTFDIESLIDLIDDAVSIYYYSIVGGVYDRKSPSELYIYLVTKLTEALGKPFTEIAGSLVLEGEDIGNCKAIGRIMQDVIQGLPMSPADAVVLTRQTYIQVATHLSLILDAEVFNVSPVESSLHVGRSPRETIKDAKASCDEVLCKLITGRRNEHAMILKHNFVYPVLPKRAELDTVMSLGMTCTLGLISNGGAGCLMGVDEEAVNSLLTLTGASSYSVRLSDSKEVIRVNSIPSLLLGGALVYTPLEYDYASRSNLGDDRVIEFILEFSDCTELVLTNEVRYTSSGIGLHPAIFKLLPGSSLRRKTEKSKSTVSETKRPMLSVYKDGECIKANLTDLEDDVKSVFIYVKGSEDLIDHESSVTKHSLRLTLAMPTGKPRAGSILTATVKTYDKDGRFLKQYECTREGEHVLKMNRAAIALTEVK